LRFYVLLCSTFLFTFSVLLEAVRTIALCFIPERIVYFSFVGYGSHSSKDTSLDDDGDTSPSAFWELFTESYNEIGCEDVAWIELAQDRDQ
jgi:hypothetical protein